MTEQPSHHLMELVYQATLKRFLRRCGISENYLAQLSSADRKRDWLDRLFPELEKSTTGKQALHKMAKFLSEQTSFPDLETCEDAEDKIKKARVAVNNLQVFLAKTNIASEAPSKQNEVKSGPSLLVCAQEELRQLQSRLSDLIPAMGTQRQYWPTETAFKGQYVVSTLLPSISWTVIINEEVKINPKTVASEFFFGKRLHPPLNIMYGLAVERIKELVIVLFGG